MLNSGGGGGEQMEIRGGQLHIKGRENQFLKGGGKSIPRGSTPPAPLKYTLHSMAVGTEMAFL